MSPQERAHELYDANLYLRLAARALTANERAALGQCVALDRSESEVAEQMSLSRQGVWYAKTQGLAKMRRALEQLGICRPEDLLS